jgi:serine/threonine-protein kinase PknG
VSMSARCSQPNCTGTLEDGYCNVCGMAAAASVVPGNSEPGGAASTKTGSHRLGSTPMGSTRTGSTRTKRTAGGRKAAHVRLGAGITSVPAAPVADARSAVMSVAEVAEEKRFCPSCGAPVGRGRGGKPGKTEGFCPTCRTPFSFTPKLAPGDLVGGQYRVVGCLAHGGLGWIYLAQDRNVSDRFVVLKGLLNSGDVDAYAAAVAERQFLAEVQHPLIVEIYNFVQDSDGAGYIVMEYVGGKSLKSILKDRMKANGGVYDPIPLDQAIAYIVEVLPALGYLHDMGLIYCDFKPDNVIQEGDALKLIDLGGVRRADDDQSAIYGTIGFQAPEVPEVGPSLPGDIYTVGRTLAVLAMEFRGYQTTFVDSLPDVDLTPLFQRYDSFHRLLARACAPDPADRFQSTEELREQLLGVLREVVAIDGRPVGGTTPSPLFEAPSITGTDLDWTQLPALKVNPADLQAAWIATVDPSDPAERHVILSAAADPTVEVRLATARAAIEAGLNEDADRIIGAILDADPWEWRAVWLSGLRALASGDHDGAVTAFNTVYGQVPGELAPKLALALACERNGNVDISEAMYRTCAATDVAYTAPASFGLARLRQVANDVPGALASLDAVPVTSRAYVEARRRRAELLASSGQGLPALASAARSLEGITLDTLERAALLAQIYENAVDVVLQHGPDPATTIGGVPAAERDLREGAEHAYRTLAAATDDREERVRLVDAANRVRPRTLV